MRPLYVYQGAHRLCFASGTQPLLAQGIPRVLDPEAADDFLSFGFVAGTRSLLRDVHPVSAGGAVYAERHRVQRWSYWSPQFETDGAPGIAECAEALVDATRSVVADSGDGAVIALSGGLGAAVIAAAASERWPAPVRTLTVRWEGGDEAMAASDTARALKAMHAVLPRGPAVATAFDDGELPVDAVGLVWRSFAEAMKPHGATVWTGVGTDVVFGGRSAYYRILKAHRRRWPLRRPLRQSSSLHAADLRAAFVRGIRRDDHRAWYTQDFLRGLRGYDGARRCVAEVRAFEGEPLSVLQHFELTVTMPQSLLAILERVERTTGLRWRLPFFDPVILDLVGSIPARYRLDAGRRELLYRAAG
ncbi:MAG: asparagine synthase-related protein, partial [Planctomycetota bacterium]